MDIYEVIAAFRASDEREKRIVAAILDDLNDRRGIKQALRDVDDDVMQELADSLVGYVRDTA